MKMTTGIVLVLASHLSLSAQDTPAEDTETNPPQAIGALDEFDGLQFLPPLAGSATPAARLALGDAHGFVHIYEQREGAYEEIWTSAFLVVRTVWQAIAWLGNQAMNQVSPTLSNWLPPILAILLIFIVGALVGTMVHRYQPAGAAR